MDQPSRDSSMKQDFTPWNGDDHAADRPLQDNGTHGATFSVGGVQTVGKVDYPLPVDVNSPAALNHYETGGVHLEELSDYGLNESVEVGYNGSIAEYGFSGKATGNGNPENTKG